MSQARRAGSVTMNYRYNGKGEQVRRFLSTTNTYTLYDEAGHWLGDYDGNGAPLQQAIWLDDLPVGLLYGGELRYIEPDHLGSPRVVIDPERDVAVWTWSLKGEAFGNTAPDQDPDGDGSAFVLDMRFPGQRYDAASGLNQNYHRELDTGIGKYTQPDPIGLDGGISTYAYVGGNPVNLVDPFGLRALTACEKTTLAPYIPKVDLDNADIHDGKMPWYTPGDMEGITRGNDIYFKEGYYDPSAPEGIALLGHELVHVGQYRNGMTWYNYLWESRKGYDPNNKYEKLAYEMGSKIQNDLTKSGANCGCDK